MKLNFNKYQGAGNDFIMINNRESVYEFDSKSVQFLCDRRFGIGADGLILLENSEQSQVDFKMKYYNADGYESTMCGNGGRCIVAFAKKLGLIKESCVFEAIDGLHEAYFEKDLVLLKMSDVGEIKQTEDFFYLNTGSPHHIVFVDDISEIDIKKKGADIRYSSAYESQNGTNVNFIQKKGNQLLIRTYERGVEDETLACGTGVTATAIASFINYENLRKPIEVKAVGGDLSVDFNMKNTQTFEDIWLKGPAEFVFKGEIEC
ncbi:diaminopimelate epimerase [Psychroflexus halocasei]|uniref:Diaminopimelate epimerase n=1 Tax=Psychroflexus halocasei TaxID=908615 RepID=A0A1H3XPW1_9FLAO|nr:diaminopimelate epimerase [Psychroflexus halocasei]SEA00558.1 diaminopimelate epimerase [Psychroflexus halocasei]